MGKDAARLRAVSGLGRGARTGGRPYRVASRDVHLSGTYRRSSASAADGAHRPTVVSPTGTPINASERRPPSPNGEFGPGNSRPRGRASPNPATVGSDPEVG